MKKIFLVAVALTAITATSCKPKYTDDYKLTSETDSVSYALGYFEGKGVVETLGRLPFDTLDCQKLAETFAISTFTQKYIDLRCGQFDTIYFEPFMHGFVHQLYFRRCKMDEKLADMVLNTRFQAVKARKAAEAAAEAEKNEAAGRAFLAENAGNEGVVVLESGVQYKVLEAGNGAKPTDAQYVHVQYEGRLLDGTVFDSSYERSGDFRCKTNGNIIDGWKEVLPLMSVGSTWEVYIPAEKAYKRQAAGEIPPGSTLIFKIELLSIEEKAAPKKK